MQVSTNPMLAVLAYEDDSYLWGVLKTSEENLRMLSDIGIKAVEVPDSLQINPFKVSKENKEAFKSTESA